jgi:hypothetical protein
MVPGWVPFKIVSVSAVLYQRWPPLLKIWTIEEISIFSDSSHLEWRAGLSDTNLKGTHPGTIPARLGLIWFSGFRGEDLNVKVYDDDTIPIFRSPGQRSCELLPSLGIRRRRKLSHLNLLLWNRWTKLNLTWQGWSLDGSLSNSC